MRSYKTLTGIIILWEIAIREKPNIKGLLCHYLLGNLFLFNMNLYDQKKKLKESNKRERERGGRGEEKESISSKTQISWSSRKHLGMVVDLVFYSYYFWKLYFITPKILFPTLYLGSCRNGLEETKWKCSRMLQNFRYIECFYN